MTDPDPARRVQLDPLRVVTLCLLGLVTITVTALIIYLQAFVGQERRTVACLQQGYAELNASFTAARAAAAQDRQAQRELLLGRLSAPDSLASVERFLEQLDEADRARAANPPPVRRCT